MVNFLIYFLVSVISYGGIIGGFFLIKTAEEEHEPLMKYFKVSRIIILILFGLLMLFYFIYLKQYLMAGVSLVLTGLMFFKDWVGFSVLGIFYNFSSGNQNLYPIITSLIFVYGMVYGSIEFKKERKEQVNILLRNAGFIVLANLFYLIR
jgi:cytochrome bd-type quinol oxidase subunit 2|tara:strand:- start:2130 stop:2579 length:450 start_codon:yes stop_codon:yes gene_type:complete